MSRLYIANILAVMTKYLREKQLKARVPGGGARAHQDGKQGRVGPSAAACAQPLGQTPSTHCQLSPTAEGLTDSQKNTTYW